MKLLLKTILVWATVVSSLPEQSERKVSACSPELELTKATVTKSQIPDIDRMFVFGDSLNDNGNLKRILLNAFPKDNEYCKGRFSNGIVWPEYFEMYLNTIYANQTKLSSKNFAVAGCSFVKKLTSISPILTSVEEQINDQFPKYVRANKITNFEKSLVTLYFGGTDYLLSKLPTDQVIAKMEVSLKKLISEYKVGYFFIGDLPFLNRPLETYSPDEAKRRDQLTAEHNVKLKQLIISLNKFIEVNNFNSKIIPFYSDQFLGPLLNGQFDPQYFDNKLTVDEPCLHKNSNKGICSNPESYLFWDTRHPTTIVHRFVAAKLIEKLKGFNDF